MQGVSSRPGAGALPAQGPHGRLARACIPGGRGCAAAGGVLGAEGGGMNRPQNQAEWTRFAEIHPPEEGEHPLLYMQRLVALAEAKDAAPEEPAGLPYRSDE